jgi:CYTH domain-containing protein
MKVEFILDARELLHMPLLTTFNSFFAESFPEALSTWVVHALFKGGNVFEFDNYRGTTVGLILAKLFAMIFDKRLNKWVE